MRDLDEQRVAAWHAVLNWTISDGQLGESPERVAAGLDRQALAEVIVWTIRWTLPRIRVQLDAAEGTPVGALDILVSGSDAARMAWTGLLSYTAVGDYDTAALSVTQMSQELAAEVLGLSFLMFVLILRGHLTIVRS